MIGVELTRDQVQAEVAAFLRAAGGTTLLMAVRYRAAVTVRITEPRPTSHFGIVPIRRRFGTGGHYGYKPTTVESNVRMLLPVYRDAPLPPAALERAQDATALVREVLADEPRISIEWMTNVVRWSELEGEAAADVSFARARRGRS